MGAEFTFTDNALQAFTADLSDSPDLLLNRLVQKAAELSNQIAGDARALVPTDTGMLKNSIIPFVVVGTDELSAGAKSDLDYAAYVEFGTGPTGQAAGHPLDAELGVVRKSEKWRVNIPDVGVRYIAGQKPQPYLYPAMKQNEEAVKEELGATFKMVVEKHG